MFQYFSNRMSPVARFAMILVKNCLLAPANPRCRVVMPVPVGIAPVPGTQPSTMYYEQQQVCTGQRISMRMQ